LGHLGPQLIAKLKNEHTIVKKKFEEILKESYAFIGIFLSEIPSGSFVASVSRFA